MFGFGKRHRQEESGEPRVKVNERVSDETLDAMAWTTGMNFDRLRGRVWRLFVDGRSHDMYIPTLEDPDQNVRPVRQS